MWICRRTLRGSNQKNQQRRKNAKIQRQEDRNKDWMDHLQDKAKGSRNPLFSLLGLHVPSRGFQRKDSTLCYKCDEAGHKTRTCESAPKRRVCHIGGQLKLQIYVGTSSDFGELLNSQNIKDQQGAKRSRV